MIETALFSISQWIILVQSLSSFDFHSEFDLNFQISQQRGRSSLMLLRKLLLCE